jgi:hypothetical protein
MYVKVFIIMILVCGCGQAKDPLTNWQQISSRDEGEPEKRFALYRAKIPLDWQRTDPSDKESIADSMKPICEFAIGSGIESVRITVHNFPSNELKERIPSASQLARWKQQFEVLSPDSYATTPLSKGGFTGLHLSATGLLDGKQSSILGWSMQMAPEQYLNLQENAFTERQKRSDYTIKAVGNPEAMEAFKSQIIDFALSFELIEEIPLR